MTSLGCLIVVGLFGLAPVLSDHKNTLARIILILYKVIEIDKQAIESQVSAPPAGLLEVHANIAIATNIGTAKWTTRQDGDGLSCSENCLSVFGYINSSQGTRISITIGAIKEKKGSETCKCRISSELKALLKSKRLNGSQLKEVENLIDAGEKFEVIKLVELHTGQEVKFLEDEEQSKSPNTGPVSSGKERRPKDLLTVKGCEEHCLEKEGYIGYGPFNANHLKVSNGKVVDSCTGSKCKCEINGQFLEYLKLKGLNSRAFTLHRTLGKGKKWLIDHKIEITFKQASSPDKLKHQHPPSPAKQESHPLPPPSEQKHQHLPKQKDNHSKSPNDQAHHHLRPLPEQRHHLLPSLAEHERESMQCRLSPSTEPSSERTCTDNCQKGFGYIKVEDSKIYVTTGKMVTKDRVRGNGKKTVCECPLNEEQLKPLLEETVYKSFEAAWKDNFENGLDVLRNHNFEVLYDKPKAKSKNSSQRHEALKATTK